MRGVRLVVSMFDQDSRVEMFHAAPIQTPTLEYVLRLCYDLRPIYVKYIFLNNID